MPKSKSNKITVTHPVTGRERKFDAGIYTAFKSAIWKSLKGSSGKTFTELTDDVIEILHQTMPGFEGSVPWYTISVRLDLESRGLVETYMKKGKKLSRLKK